MKIKIFIPLFIFALSGCGNSKQEIPEEDWMNLPVSDWPDIVFINRIAFSDSVYDNLANAFLVNTGYDTLAVTCKHIFLVFRKENLTTIDPGEKFLNWYIHPKLRENSMIELSRPVNQYKTEEVGAFNTLKSRDWLIFYPTINNGYNPVPLKIRDNPVLNGEILYAVGWATRQVTGTPALIKIQVFKDMGRYFYFNTLTLNVDPAGRSGSPVIDQKGHLVGLISGAEGKLGVAAAVSVLKSVLHQHEINYITANEMNNRSDNK